MNFQYLMSKSKIGLVLLGLCCCSLIWLSIPKGIASLYKLGLDNQFERIDREVTAQELEALDSLSQELYQLDPADPSNLLVVGYTDINLGFQSGEESQASFMKARELTLEAITLRPLDHVSYAQLAYIEAYLNKDFSLVRDALEKAQKVGPFERYTASAGIDIYFSHWSKLNRQEKLKAVAYITQYRKYGLSFGDVNRLVSRSPKSKALCKVNGIKHLNLPSCR